MKLELSDVEAQEAAAEGRARFEPNAFYERLISMRETHQRIWIRPHIADASPGDESLSCIWPSASVMLRGQVSDADEKPDARNAADIPAGEAATVQKLVQRELANIKHVLALDYRIKEYLDLRERRRRLLLEASDLETRMKRLEIPPAILKSL